MSPANDITLSANILEEDVQLSLGDLSRACCVEADFIVELVQEGIIDPLEPHATRWAFNGICLLRVRKALNLQRDLGVNLAGIALALDLLEETDRLRAQLSRLS